MNVAAMIRVLIAKGLSAEDIAEAFEALGPISLEPQPTARQARNRRYYESKRRLNKTESDAVKTDSDAFKTPATLPLEANVPPTPPLKTQTLTPSKNPPSGVKKVPARRPTRMCPADWNPSDETIAKLTGEGFSPGALERSLTRMRDHEFATAHSHWDAVFRNWVRRDGDQRQAKESFDDAKYRNRQENIALSLAVADRLAEYVEERRGRSEEFDFLKPD